MLLEVGEARLRRSLARLLMLGRCSGWECGMEGARQSRDRLLVHCTQMLAYCYFDCNEVLFKIDGSHRFPLPGQIFLSYLLALHRSSFFSSW